MSDTTPIDMILHCPACGMQHIDGYEGINLQNADGGNRDKWTNPPHRSHLCHGCGHIWRPADVPTNGVAAIKTKGENDSPPPRSTYAAPPARTIYDNRSRIDDAARAAGPRLAVALKDLLEAVEERRTLAGSIESAVLGNARYLVANLRATPADGSSYSQDGNAVGTAPQTTPRG